MLSESWTMTLALSPETVFLQDAGGGVLVLDVLLRMAFALLVVQAQAIGDQCAALLDGEAAGDLAVACQHGRVELGGDLGWGVAVEAEKRKEEGGEGDQDGGGLTEFHTLRCPARLFSLALTEWPMSLMTPMLMRRPPDRVA